MRQRAMRQGCEGQVDALIEHSETYDTIATAPHTPALHAELVRRADDWITTAESVEYWAVDYSDELDGTMLWRVGLLVENSE